MEKARALAQREAAALNPRDDAAGREAELVGQGVVAALVGQEAGRDAAEVAQREVAVEERARQAAAYLEEQNAQLAAQRQENAAERARKHCD